MASSPGCTCPYAGQQRGLDPSISDQLTLQALTSAMTQQQLNAATARAQVANTCNVLTMTVQLNSMATLKQLTSTSPIDAAAIDNVLKAGSPQHFAGLNTAAGTPRG